MDGLSRHQQQMEGKLLEGEMFTPASLEISNEEWNQLVHAGTHSTHRRCSIGKDALKNFAKLTGKHLCQSLFFSKVAGLGLQLCKKDTLAQVLSCKFCKVFQNTFFHRTPLRNCFCKDGLIRNQQL